ncbi:MAG: CPBP family intramembrane metalloprotease [Caryophanon sp.]|nr:CPBP family intramembrane metalloprotease [Caryophanon sp.]
MELQQKQQPKLTAIYVIVIYVAMQLSGFFLQFPAVFTPLANMSGLSGDAASNWVVGMWSAVTFAVACVLTLAITTVDKSFWQNFRDDEKAPLGQTIGWGIAGFFLVMIAQYIAIYIETLLGIDPGSDNTGRIIEISKVAPFMIVATVLFGPILEEILFRRVIFGSFLPSMKFFGAALISSIVFAAIHMDFTHMLIYIACGFTFAFIYYKTKRILASIITHVLMNGFVTLAALTIDPTTAIIVPFM